MKQSNVEKSALLAGLRRCVAPCSLAGIVALGSVAVAPVMAEEVGPASTAAPATAVADGKPTGLLPLPDYSGDLGSRSRLTGDWGGTRTDLANKGVQLDVDFTQYVQGVTSGGRDTGARYGGSLDYLLNVDLMQMGVLPGALLTLRAESRYGEAANDISGAVLPVNTEGLFPLAENLDEEIPVTITTLRYVQFLSEQFGLMVGKFDTLESTNEFAGGRGVYQFMNGNFVFPPAGALSVPYSTLGAGAIVMPVKNLTINSIVMNTNDSSTTSGFDDIGEGWTWLTSVQYQYMIGSLPGGQSVAATYAADNEFKEVAGGLVFQPGEGLAPAKTDETWFVSWDLWQYLWINQPAQKPIDIANGTQDLQGLGAFVRVGFGDEDSNPIDYTIAAGLGARGVIPVRDHDTMGIGYAYSRIRESRLTSVLSLESHSQAFEAYYNIEVTPATHLSLDVQVVDSIASTSDTAVLVGARLNFRF